MTYSCAIFKDIDGDLVRDGAKQGAWNGGAGLIQLGSKDLTGSAKSASTSGTQTPSEDGAYADSGTYIESRFNPEEYSDELHEAQIRKLDHIIRCARIQPGQRVLEIGSGWGSMAIRIASCFPDTTIDTLTLSVHQQSLALERIREAGPEIASRIRVHLMDYRDIPAEWEGLFDRVISVEMIEAVGKEFLERYWQIVDGALKKKGGVGVVQVITIPEPRKSSFWTMGIMITQYYIRI